MNTAQKEPMSNEQMCALMEKAAKVLNHSQAVANALREIMLWRKLVNEHPGEVVAGMGGDPAALAIALFNGPAWDRAERALLAPVLPQ